MSTLHQRTYAVAADRITQHVCPVFIQIEQGCLCVLHQRLSLQGIGCTNKLQPIVQIFTGNRRFGGVETGNEFLYAEISLGVRSFQSRERKEQIALDMQPLGIRQEQVWRIAGSSLRDIGLRAKGELHTKLVAVQSINQGEVSQRVEHVMAGISFMA